MKSILTILVLSLFLHSEAQSFTPDELHALDSMDRIIDNPEQHDTTKVWTLLEKALYFYISNPDSALSLCENAKELSEKNDFIAGKGESYAWIGFLSQRQGNILKALEYNHKSLKIKETLKDSNGMSTAYNNIGVLYDDQGDYENALLYYNKALIINKALNNLGSVATCYNNIGFIKFSNGEIDEGLSDMRTSLEICKEIKDKNGEAISLSNLGLMHNKLHQKEIYNQFQKDSLIELAINYFNESIIIFKELNNKSRLSNSYSNLGFIYIDQGKIGKAKEMGENAFALAEEIGFRTSIKNAANLLHLVYEKQGKGMKALEMHKLYIEMKDSLNNDEVQRKTLQEQAQYEYEKQKALDEAEHQKEIAIKNSEHEKALAIEKAAKQKQSILAIGSIIGLALVIIFSIILFNRLRITRQQKSVIEEQKSKVEKQKEIIEETHKEITDSIQYAKRLQNAILPSVEKLNKEISENFIFYLPKNVVSGDFYWLEKSNKYTYLAVADCTGHGVPGAMVSLVCSNALNKAVNEFNLEEPSDILNKTREIVIGSFAQNGEEVKDGMDISLCAINENFINFSGANNPLWIVRKSTGKSENVSITENGFDLIEIKGDKQPIGLYDKMEPFKQTTLEIQKGDTIYFFSDGYADQFGGEKGKKFMYKSMKKMFLEMQNYSMKEQFQQIEKEFFKWKGDLEQIDDICVIGIKFS
ncbi:tetratricopeptide repeat protein [Paracrocinitomix mangrovi]|uniref:tetratricopeptide repeat protein n=1 Tax=Paracrocinitomix mangrovi TaxID=2862509 RepID=UPI001C8D5BFB|nr:tetratricopeptide repeat protein [Paracrocinitomix mangrovi]UKN02188.1 tetratricopeptide repeat protein [Paracrocinitomix mangrovi]